MPTPRQILAAIFDMDGLLDGKTIDMPIKGHVSFRGKNGIKGEVVMRNGKILGWAWGAGFVDGDVP